VVHIRIQHGGHETSEVKATLDPLHKHFMAPNSICKIWNICEEKKKYNHDDRVKYLALQGQD
jgi:hypothetical protein